MLLCRTTRDGNTQHCEHRKSFHRSEGLSECVNVPFGYFGEGDERVRWPHFKVVVDWSDVEALIAKFHQMKHPKALRIKKAGKIAAALERFMKEEAALHRDLFPADCPPQSSIARWTSRGRT